MATAMKHTSGHVNLFCTVCGHGALMTSAYTLIALGEGCEETNSTRQVIIIYGK